LKHYEGSNQLGNVLSVFTDRKILRPNSSGDSVNHYEPDIISGTDYYAFGAPMYGRTFESNNFRYGFNGKEKDDETFGNGNEYDYGFRIYNPRLGKFLSIDPLGGKYPSYSPYQFAMNDPIESVDMDGLESSNGTTQKASTNGETKVKENNSTNVTQKASSSNATITVALTYQSQFSTAWDGSLVAAAYKANKADRTDQQNKIVSEFGACYQTAVKMLNNATDNKGSGAYYSESAEKDRSTQMAQMGPDGKTINTIKENFQTGIDEIDNALNDKQVIIVGVNHDGAAKGFWGNDMNTEAKDKPVTEHYLVIYGKGTDEKGTYYLYYDPGAYPGNAAGTTKENKLYIRTDPNDPNSKQLAGESNVFKSTTTTGTGKNKKTTTGKATYIVTQVRKNAKKEKS
ncbi:MAG TPA: RHS repeat-associated core domain-containing protein, partial [Bacteroidia bacterium]|nr:RHS repeat-associated core domain-containing protein [Bacteroidia bacterium]